MTGAPRHCRCVCRGRVDRRSLCRRRPSSRLGEHDEQIVAPSVSLRSSTSVATSATTLPTDAAAPDGTPTSIATAITSSPPPTSDAVDATERPPAQPYDFSAADPLVSEFVAADGFDGAGLIVVHRDDGVDLPRPLGRIR